MVAPEKSLPDVYYDWIASTVDANGFEIPHGFMLTDKGMSVVALALEPTDAYRYMLTLCAKENAKEMIFALDRFARPNQGTTLGDLLAGHYFSEGHFRPFIIEYQYEPRLIRPIDYTNTFWNAALAGELVKVVSAMNGQRGARA